MCDIFMIEIENIKIKYSKKLHVTGLRKTCRCIMINSKNKIGNLVLDYKRKYNKFCKNTNVIVWPSI